MKKGMYVAIVTVKFKAGNTCSSSVAKWKPGTITARLCYLCPKYDEKKVLYQAREKATAWAKELESKNEGLMVTFTTKVDATRIDSADVLDDKGNNVTLSGDGELQ